MYRTMRGVAVICTWSAAVLAACGGSPPQAGDGLVTEVSNPNATDPPVETDVMTGSDTLAEAEDVVGSSGTGAGRIAFSRPLPQGGSAVYTVNPDGSDEQLVALPEPNEDFGRGVFSPNGDRLLFSNVFRYDGGEISRFRPAVAETDGSDIEVFELPDMPSDMYCTAWSADGQVVLCAVGSNSMWSLPVVDVEAQPVELEASAGLNDVPVGYSPNGYQLSFLRFDANGNVALFVADADGEGGGARSLADDEILLGHELASAAWAPDGASLLSTTADGRLVSIAADGFGVDTISLDLEGGQYFAFTPSYSPDGSRIVFAASVGAGEPDLYTADPDGSNVAQITHTETAERFPNWTAATDIAGVGGEAGTTQEPRATANPSATSASGSGSAYATSGFIVPFRVTLPEWANAAPDVEDSNFLTWESSSGRAIRFLAPVSVYPPGSRTSTPVPHDYVDYLSSQTRYGATLADLVETELSGTAATLMNATTVSALDGGLGCQTDGLPAPDCYGLQPGLELRLAVLQVDDQVLLIWERYDAGHPPDDQSFDIMLASLQLG